MVDTPQANLMVFPDGKTNIPEPKIKKKPSDKSAVETIVDLAVGKFDLVNAGAEWVDQPSVIDGNLVSSQVPRDLPAFGVALLEVLRRQS